MVYINKELNERNILINTTKTTLMINQIIEVVKHSEFHLHIHIYNYIFLFSFEFCEHLYEKDGTKTLR